MRNGVQRSGAAEPKADDSWSSGALCLDFANTLGQRLKGGDESLHAYSDLLLWGIAHGALSDHRARAMSDRSELRPAEAAAALDRALELRECIYRVLFRLATRKPPDEPDLAQLNRIVAKAMAHRKLRSIGSGFEWTWSEGESVLERMLWPIAESAGDLLVSEEAAFVRQCSAKDCDRLFVDRSRTKRRRWCDMKTCGNRNKARRHLERLKTRSQDPS